MAIQFNLLVFFQFVKVSLIFVFLASLRKGGKIEENRKKKRKRSRWSQFELGSGIELPRLVMYMMMPLASKTVSQQNNTYTIQPN